MRRAKAIAATLGSVWIAFVILACSDTDAEVEGDLVRSGRCPEGESCAPRGSGPRYFLAAKPPGGEPVAGELPPVAVGATTWVRFVQENEPAFFAPAYVDVPGARLEVEGSIEMGSGLEGTTLRATTEGTFTVRAVDSRGNLHDRTRIRAVDPATLIVRPAVAYVGPVGPQTGWRVWPETEVFLLREARSEWGERLVARTGEADPYLGAMAPASGALEVDDRLGELTTTARFPVATSVDSIVGYTPEACNDGGFRDYYLCLYGVSDGQPVFGAPLTVIDRDEEGELLEYDLGFWTSLPCVDRREDPRSVTVIGPTERWIQAVPALGTSCGEE